MYVDNFQINHRLKLNHYLDSIKFLRYLTILNLLNDRNSTKNNSRLKLLFLKTSNDINQI